MFGVLSHYQHTVGTDRRGTDPLDGRTSTRPDPRLSGFRRSDCHLWSDGRSAGIGDCRNAAAQLGGLGLAALGLFLCLHDTLECTRTEEAVAA